MSCTGPSRLQAISGVWTQVGRNQAVNGLRPVHRENHKTAKTIENPEVTIKHRSQQQEESWTIDEIIS